METEVIRIRYHEEEDTTILYEAARRGCVETLNILIEKDPLILNKVSLTSFSETPLHISSLLGHLHFTTALLTRNPKMATKLDSAKHSPLHLASAEGHTEIVKALLSSISKDFCLVRDRDGRIALHFAAMRGNVGTIKELVSACPESISELLDGDTVLHLCVKYNQLEALKLLMKLVKDDELINKGNDQEGNTILHLALMLKQLEIVNYMVSEARVRAEINTLNKMGLTALDLIECCPRHYKTPEIRNLLMECGATRAINKPNSSSISALPRPPPPPQPAETWLDKLNKYLDRHGNWIEETRGTLLTVATLIASITFQVVTNPPGGVWQADTMDNSCNFENGSCLAGTAVFGSAYPDDYRLFMIYNSIAFVASLIVIFLIISGFPVENKIFIWVLTVAMSATVPSMAITYIVSIDMVTPNNLLKQFYWLKKISLFVLVGMVSFVCAIHIFRFLIWASTKSTRRSQIWWRSSKFKFGTEQEIDAREQTRQAIC